MRFPFVLFVAFAICANAAAETKTYLISKGQAVEIADDSSLLKQIEDSDEIFDDIPNKSLLMTPRGWVQGVCDENRKPLIYTENFILENDNKSQVSAVITISIGGNTNITCVEIANRANRDESPKILGGGVGSNQVTVSVSPGYGKGFDFTVRIYGVFE